MQSVEFEINGERVSAQPGETLLEVTDRLGLAVPRLCHKPGYRPDGNCRACVVEIEGERTLAASCCRQPSPGLKVHTHSERALNSQRMVLEMLLADMPDAPRKWDSEQPQQGGFGELSSWAHRLGVNVRPELKALARSPLPADASHPAMLVQLDACIHCDRCVRACQEVQVNDVIGQAHRGAHSQIVFDLQDPMGQSTCVACGECVQACPTGALSSKTKGGDERVDREVDSVCPFCGVGCLLTYEVRGETIVGVKGRDGPANRQRLCVKGRFGFDYAHHPQRLTTPLIRRDDAPKNVAEIEIIGRDAQAWQRLFRPATWEEALDKAAAGLARLKQNHGPKSLAGFGSAKGSNEEAYLFQKLVRTGLGSNNVDHCTRLCHASSVAALLEGVGSGAVSNPVHDVTHADFILVIGSNPTANHPVAATWMKNAAQRGARIVLADPRVTDLGRHAWRVLPFRPDTDVALLSALLHVIVQEDLVNHAFVAQRVDDFEALAAHVSAPIYSPEAMAPICGIDAQTLREVARAYARAKSAMILWGMGVSQHTHGTDNVRCLIALAALTGQLGRPGTGLHPLRGQNNVQGASDAGLIPMMYPNYQRVDDADARTWFEEFWQTSLDPLPGYTVVEIMEKALAAETDPHKIRGLYIMGENPAMSDPDLNHTREALASLEHLVVQDIFMTETACLADVILPASAWPEKMGTVSNTDRMVQLGRPAVALPGEARLDLWVIQQMAQRLGLNWSYSGEYAGVAEVYEEMRQAMQGAIGGIHWERLLREGSVTYPCLSAEDPGQPIVFTERVPTASGRIRLVCVDLLHAHELPDEQYPFVLMTGRQLEHWHTGSMTRRSEVLDALEPQATASLCSQDMAKLGLQPGDVMTLLTRRGQVSLYARLDEGTPAGSVFVPFAYYEAAANKLTNPALDPFGKIPEFKYCAVRIEAGGEISIHSGYERGSSAIMAS